MKVNVLGTDYEIIEQSESDNPKLRGANGICEVYAHKIILNADVKEDEMSFENFQAFKNRVLRHEIIHAFFAESGMMENYSDEVLVDWIAFQSLKMAKAFKDAGCDL